MTIAGRELGSKAKKPRAVSGKMSRKVGDQGSGDAADEGDEVRPGRGSERLEAEAEPDQGDHQGDGKPGDPNGATAVLLDRDRLAWGYRPALAAPLPATRVALPVAKAAGLVAGRLPIWTRWVVARRGGPARTL